MVRCGEVLQSCVDRILQSATFANAPSSRRLLKYLCDHAAQGNAVQLKEYTIGVEAFAKSAGYDPRQDSTVRIQIGRLRQKLAEYYRDHGAGDAAVVELPKGQFTLICEPRPAATVEVQGRGNQWRAIAIVFAGLCVVLLSIVVWNSVRGRIAAVASAASAESWSLELAELWGPFVDTGRPLLIAVGNPLFLQFENKALYRDLSVENSDELAKSPRLKGVRQALGSPASRPVHYYAAVGDVSAAFQLGQRLGTRQPRMSIVRSSQLQWQQMADGNVLFLGPPRFFGDKLNGLPVTLEIVEGQSGFQVLHPKTGEQSLYEFRDPPGFFNEDGEACVLISRAPGPGGNTEVMTFASNSTFGRLGAVNALTDPAFAHVVAARMRTPAGQIPKYFQVLLRVKYKGGVPTDTTYLLHREIHRRG